MWLKSLWWYIHLSLQNGDLEETRRVLANNNADDISQLLDIRGFDTARLNRLTDRIYIDPASQHPLDLYTIPIDSMAAHPYIGPYAAKGIDRLRRTLPRAEFSFRSILENNILTDEQAKRLSLYFQTD